MKIHVYTDASVTRKPAKAGLAVIVHFPTGKETFVWTEELPRHDATRGELLAIQGAVLILMERDLCIQNISSVCFHTDSRTVISILKGEITPQRYTKMSRELLALLDGFRPWELEHIEDTNPAHDLSRKVNGLGRSYAHPHSRRHRKLQEKRLEWFWYTM